MTAKEYIEQLFTSHDIDWLVIKGGENRVMVSFLESSDVLRPKLEKAGEGVFTELSLLPRLGDKGCMAIIRLNPHKLEEPTLAQAFATLVKSAADFHERFDTTKDMAVAVRVFREEVEELVEECDFLTETVSDMELECALFAGEWADVLTTMFGLARAAGVSHEQLAAAMLQVAAKNDAKTHETHVKHPVTGKVTSRTKLEGGA